MNGFLTALIAQLASLSSVNLPFLLINSKNSAHFSPFRLTGGSGFQIQTVLALIVFMERFSI